MRRSKDVCGGSFYVVLPNHNSLRLARELHGTLSAIFDQTTPIINPL